MAASESVKKLTQLAATAISEKLGVDVIALDMTDQMLLSEVFLIATASNVRQVEAIADEEKASGSYFITATSLFISKVKSFAVTTCLIAYGMTALVLHLKS